MGLAYREQVLNNPECMKEGRERKGENVEMDGLKSQASYACSKPLEQSFYI